MKQPISILLLQIRMKQEQKETLSQHPTCQLELARLLP